MQAYLSGYNAVKFVADDLEVWIKEKYANDFEGCSFYAYAPLNRVLIKAPTGLLIALVMPIRPPKR